MSPHVIGAIVVGASVLVGLLVLSARRTRRREAERVEALRAWAAQREWAFRTEDAALVTRFRRQPFARGSRRRAHNVVSGRAHGRSFTAFEYLYDTTSTNGEGQSTTDTHRFAVLAVHLGVPVPELAVGRSTTLQRLWGKLFGSDIALGDAEFDRDFAVRSESPELARDVLQPMVRDTLRRHPDIAWRFEGDSMLVVRRGRHTPTDIQERLDYASAVLAGVPPYVWQRLAGEPPR
ncbi:hypothetical protein GCM10028801_21710 [Nocardioides maradonensis]